MYKHTDGWTDLQKDNLISKWRNNRKQKDKQTDKCINSHKIDRWTEEQADK